MKSIKTRFKDLKRTLLYKIEILLAILCILASLEGINQPSRPNRYTLCVTEEHEFKSVGCTTILYSILFDLEEITYIIQRS